jgi:hypothetical protein
MMPSLAHSDVLGLGFIEKPLRLSIRDITSEERKVSINDE